MKSLSLLIGLLFSLLLNAQQRVVLNTSCGSMPYKFLIQKDTSVTALNTNDSLLETIRINTGDHQLFEIKKYPSSCTAQLLCYAEIYTGRTTPRSARYWVSSTHNFSSDSARDILRVLQFLKPIPDGQVITKQIPPLDDQIITYEIATKRDYLVRVWGNPERWSDSIVQKAPLLAVLNFLKKAAIPHKTAFTRILPPGTYRLTDLELLTKAGKNRKNGYYEKRRLNGRLKVQGFYQNGEKTGEWCFYNKKATTRFQGQLVNGIREGSWYLVSVNDEVRIDGTRYSNGRVVSRMTMSW